MDAVAVVGVLLMFIGSGLLGRAAALPGSTWSFVVSVGVLLLGLLTVLLGAAIQKGVL